MIIDNYKSIEHLEFELNRVTVLIGPPASGKSNILEAIAFVGYPWRLTQKVIYGQPQNVRPLLNRIIKSQDINSIFSRGTVTRDLRIEISKTPETKSEEVKGIKLNIGYKSGRLCITYCGIDITHNVISCISTPPQQWLETQLPIFEARLYSYDRYEFTTSILQRGNLASVLTVPISDVLLENGENILYVLRNYPDILIKVNEFLNEFLETKIDVRVLRSVNQIVIFDYHVEIPSTSSLSDGIWRILYYTAALYSVKQYAHRYGLKDRLIVLLEEPDAHTFPYFIHLLTDLIREISEYAYVVLTTHNSIFASLITSKVPNSTLYYVYRNKEGWTCVKRINFEKLAEHLATIDDILLMRPSEVIEKFGE